MLTVGAGVGFAASFNSSEMSMVPTLKTFVALFTMIYLLTGH